MDIIAGISPLETLRVAQSAFAKVVKVRESWVSVFGLLNMRKADSPWRDVRVRQAANFAINREDLIRYATQGNGVILPALLPVQGFGYNPDLTPYPFAPNKARDLLREAGYPEGLSMTLIATPDLEVQATVISKMLELSGFKVTREVLGPAAFGQKTYLRHLDKPPEQQPWDIVLISVAERSFSLLNLVEMLCQPRL